MLFSLKRRRLCHTVLAALRGAYGFAPAQAAISIAAKTARVPHGQRHHVSAAGSLARSCGCAARRPRSARHCFRDLLMTLDRLCRYSLPLAFRAENAALALRAPSMPHDHAAGSIAPWLATLAPPAVRVMFNTILERAWQVLLQNRSSRTTPSTRFRPLRRRTRRSRLLKPYQAPGVVPPFPGRLPVVVRSTSAAISAEDSPVLFLSPPGAKKTIYGASSRSISSGVRARAGSRREAARNIPERSGPFSA